MNKKWTEQDTEVLIRLYNEGKTQVEIIKLMHSARCTIACKIDELKKQGLIEERFISGKEDVKSWNGYDEAVLIDQWIGGNSIENIAEMLGRTVYSTQAKRIRLGLHCRRHVKHFQRKNYVDEESKRIIEKITGVRKLW